jgi:hypothetical protein
MKHIENIKEVRLLVIEKSQKISNQRIGVDRHFPKELGERRPFDSSLTFVRMTALNDFVHLRVGRLVMISSPLTWGRIDNTDQAVYLVIPKTTQKHSTSGFLNLQLRGSHDCGCIRPSKFVQSSARGKEPSIEEIRRSSSTFQDKRTKFQDACCKAEFQEFLLIWLN